MQTVVELDSYLRDAKLAGMSDDDRQGVVDLVAKNPMVGTPIAGGARKVRIAKRGSGKSGGYRVVFFYSDASIPVFLITVFGKGEKDNLTRAEKNALGDLTNRLRDAYGK